MEYYELTATAYLCQDVYFNEANYLISQFISGAMLLDRQLSEKHKRNEYKYYCFNSFFPLEPNKIYKKGRIYIFKIRTLQKDFAEKILRLLPDVKNQSLKVLACEKRVVKQRHISELYTVTPVLITVDNKHWLAGDNLALLQRRLHDNLEKKYRIFYKEELCVDESFIQGIELLNKKPLSYKYKNARLLGNKFKITVNENIMSQKLAFMAEATGVGEKSSAAGMGFCTAQYLK